MPLTWKQIQINAVAFEEEWAGVSYEKGESQTFYNEFFEGVFGVKRKRVARFEEFVRAKGKAPGFIDLLWPGVLIVEHKSLGEDLEKAAEQADQYFDALSEDDKPRYRLVCDFQTFSLLDRDRRTKVEFVLTDLHRNVEHFAFMLGKQTPKNTVREHLNREAAERIASIHRDLTGSKYPERDLERFLTRLVFCLFADNTGIFQPRGLFVDLVESRTRPDGTDLGPLLAYLFQVLDTPPDRRQQGLDPDLADFPYVNGGLFAERMTMPQLNAQIRDHLLAACAFDWSEVSPAIFGSLFQSVLSKEEKRNIGGFSTSEENIMKVVSDLFLTSLQSEFDELRAPGVRKVEALRAFRGRLARFRVFDPACGCGNFLAIAYRELRRLEVGVLLELNRLGVLNDDESKASIIDVDQFFGIERRPYSARIAETAMWMTDHIANNAHSFYLKVDFQRVPLAKAPKIVVADALRLDWASVIPPDSCTHILSNPPYKGPKYQSEDERRQVRRIARLGGSGGTLDYACGWVLKSAEYAEKGVRVGLVTVNSLSQGEQVGQLWPALFDRFNLEIDFAHQPFQWYSDSGGRPQVQVIVLGLVRKGAARGSKPLYQYATATSQPTVVACRHISPYLVVGDDLGDPHGVVREAHRPINGLRKIRTGTKPIDGGYYILTEHEREELVAREPGAASCIRPFIGGDEFLKGEVRYILVLEGVPPKELRGMREVRELITKVHEYRCARIGHKVHGTMLKKPNDLRRFPTRFHITSLPRHPFLVIPEVTSERRRYVPIGWLEPPAVPSNLVKYLQDATLPEFAVLTSAMHMAWLRVVGGRLEGRLRYSIGIVYNTFPIVPRMNSVALSRVAKAVLAARRDVARGGASLADMYDAEVMPPSLLLAHEALDREVDRHYLGRVATGDQDRVVNLLNRYREMRR